MAGRRIGWWCLVVLLAVATVVAVALGGSRMVAQRAQPAPLDGPAQRSAVLDIARADIPKIFSYTPATVESALTDAASLMTERFGKEFLDKAHADVISQARQRQITTQTAVVGAGVETMTRAQASVLVFTNRTVTQADKEPQHDSSRLRVQLQKSGTTWLVDDIQPI